MLPEWTSPQTPLHAVYASTRHLSPKVKAFVVLRPGAEGSAALVDQLKERVRSEAGGYKVPEQIVFVDILPRTTLQKIDRRALREAEQDGR